MHRSAKGAVESPFKPKLSATMWENYLTRTLGRLVDGVADSALVVVDSNVKDFAAAWEWERQGISRWKGVDFEEWKCFAAWQGVRDSMSRVLKDRFRCHVCTFCHRLDGVPDKLTYHYLDIRLVRTVWAQDSSM